MKISSLKNFILFSSIVLFVGCESTGKIQAVTNGKVVQFDYQQGLFENDGLLSVVMPDGERFSGKFVQNTSSSSGSDWEIGESSNDDALILKDSTIKSSQAKAVLIGDKGNTMQCQFQFSDPDSGVDGGGVGSCETSNNQKVHATF